ncbi:2,5-diketo-D-gluconate reductase B [Halopelagius inordinatus]|uniref:2,5-diketo-D-gluconate reductase B n=1 Tax=Halopelagius inordinatus TaxID=553467 RepID=A0A1I2NU48_9EURY|nr:aldo/keto reductase [Halopelagius inordinatus]SFG07402.1 2,5-diketo-D-gluconate reductase B [Halopelagius inordinatus]
MTAFDLPDIGFGTSGNDDLEECTESVAAALNRGYRHVDTAQMYDNEAAVGEGVRRSDVDRSEVVIATKIHPDNLAPEDVRRTAEESLDRLGVDSVEMLYVHWPTSAYDAETTLPAFDELADRGLVDHVCVSNFTPELLAEAREVLDSPVAAHQVECHPLLRQDELRADARDHGYSLVSYAPLGRGEFFDDPTLVDIAEKHDATPAQVCLAWAMAQESVVPIPKATGDHIAENFAARDVELDEEDIDRIADIDREKRIIDPDDAPWNR